MVSPLCHCVAPPLLYSCVGVNVKGVNPHSHFCLCHVATSKVEICLPHLIILFINAKIVGVEADEDRIESFLSEVKGKDIVELIAAGREKLASVPSGGGGAVAVAVSVLLLLLLRQRRRKRWRRKRNLMM
ncbi:60S acidic ribosomal protein P2B [Glycine soja]|nr:60S acidic ribosomal protein P2B [Glycine soja]